MGKDEVLQIRCDEWTEQAFRAFAQQYDTQEDALIALLDAYANDINRMEAVTFETDRLK